MKNRELEALCLLTKINQDEVVDSFFELKELKELKESRSQKHSVFKEILQWKYLSR